MIGYQIHTHPVISLPEDNDDDLGADFSEFDEKLFSELQSDFEINWIPKLTALDPQHPLAVQLNTDNLGSGIQIVSNDVTFDVFYDGTAPYDHPMFLTEIVVSVNHIGRASTYSGNKSYVESIKGELTASDWFFPIFWSSTIMDEVIVSFYLFVGYRISTEIVMDINMNVEDSTDEFEDYDEELFFKLQSDVSNRFANTRCALAHKTK
ncbi:hypothetical protein PHET_03496 [Paragonimus heterotremus]|uniref:Uncharacterized protein n=1 Tax=Paragonimus heterotremus TaxID=100268 RepID=A0A8J4SRF8_9TREM|nr:hypothetical protein PHET_03496 [Paragonimus heterotremus]